MRSLSLFTVFYVAAGLSAAEPNVSDKFYNAIRTGDQAAVDKLLAGGADVNTRDSRGNTPLMYAAAVGSPSMLRNLLDKGADPKAKNTFDSTALMWCSNDLAKVRLLLDKGADVNARTKQGGSVLFIAAAHDGNAAVIRLLLERGADTKAPGPAGATAALMMSARANDTESAKLLLEQGAVVKAKGFAGFTALISAAGYGNAGLVKLLLARGADVNAQTDPAFEKVKNGDIGIGSLTPLLLAVNAPSPETVRLLLDAGADVNVRDVRGMTPLMLAVASDHADPEIVRLLLAKSPAMDARSKNGETALDWALKFRNPAILPLIRKASTGIEPASHPPVSISYAKVDARSAVEKSVAMMQKTYTSFFREGGCVGCHAGNITSMTVAAARARGVRVDEPAAAELARSTRVQYTSQVEGMLQRQDPPAVEILMMSLMGLASERVPADRTIDAVVHNIAAQQHADGSWGSYGIMRPPTADSLISLTAFGIRSLRDYTLPARKAEFEERIARAARWLQSAEPVTTEDAVMQLLGLKWAGLGASSIDRAARRVLALQRADGGWAQTPHLQSDAYATGTALWALREAGAGKAQAHKKGVSFLLSTQAADGTWHVVSRAPKFQPYFESGFPYAHDQWISQWATGYASLALSYSLPETRASK
ncbi:MAG TPA: ankyrin repeat domain-containing protein [Bryobacteraceae bacterium]|nr:ankyrin repeat domain-containing protein [Bryobacteraceae bacterium]